MRTFWQALIGQLKAILADKGALLLMVVAPLLYSAFYPLPYLNHVVREVPLAIVDLDQSAPSRQIARWISAHPNVSTQMFADPSTAEAALRAGKLGGIAILPQGLQRDLAQGRPITLPVIADAAYFLVYRQALTAVLEASGTYAAQIQVGRSLAAGHPLELSLSERDPHSLVVRPVFNPTESYLPYIVPAVYILILQQTLIMGLALLAGTAREREKAKSKQVIGGGLATLLGRTASLVFLYSLHALYFWGWSTHLFGLPTGGESLHLFLLLFPFLLAVSFLGLALEPLFREREQAFAYLLFTSLPILFVSGFVWPREAMPDWMPVFAALFPTTPGIEGTLALLAMNASWASVAPQAIHLWILAAILLIPALLASRHRL